MIEKRVSQNSLRTINFLVNERKVNKWNFKKELFKTFGVDGDGDPKAEAIYKMAESYSNNLLVRARMVYEGLNL